jgi:hypothetical protein
MAGFDQQTVNNWIGLEKIVETSDMESCHRTLAQANCGHE